MEWVKARMSIGNGECFEVAFKGQQVLVRNSRFPAWKVPPLTLVVWSEWRQNTLRTGKLDLSILLPREVYGAFSDSFTQAELDALLDGIMNEEPQLIG